MKNFFSKLIPIVSITLLSLCGFAEYELDKNGIPAPPNPPKLVNIIPASASPFTPKQIKSLEQELVNFSKSTSTQIVLVVVDNFQGNDKASYATEIGHKWKVGQKGKDNGIVILLKPKEVGSGKGEAFIATGYGLEGVIPDAIAKRIVEFEMIPSFKQKDYYGGIKKSIAVLKGLALKEFTAKQYIDKRKKGSGKGIAQILIFVVFAVLFLIARNRSNNQYYSPGRNIPFWTLLFMGNSMGRSRGGSWDNFSSGGGGFGGFGGGGFGGGGAGGSW